MLLKIISSLAVGVLFYFLLPVYINEPLSAGQRIGFSAVAAVGCYLIASVLYRRAGRPLSWPPQPRKD